MRFVSLYLFVCSFLIVSCGKVSNQKEKFQQRLSKSSRIIEKTERIMVIDPVLVKGTMDTMKTIISQINTTGRELIEKSAESKSAFYIYTAAYQTFENYLEGHDEVAYLISTHRKEIAHLQKEVEKWDGKDSVALTEKIENTEAQVRNNYVHGTELMREYLAIVNQFARKRDLIEKFYHQITPQNGD